MILSKQRGFVSVEEAVALAQTVFEDVTHIVGSLFLLCICGKHLIRFSAHGMLPTWCVS